MTFTILHVSKHLINSNLLFISITVSVYINIALVLQTYIMETSAWMNE